MKRVVSVMAVLMLAACNSGDTEDEAVNEKSQQVAESETNEEAENNDSEEVETEESSEDEESSDTSEADKAQEESSDSEPDVESQNEETEETDESAEDNTEVAEDEAHQETAVREFTDAEKQAMVDEFYTWAVERAEVGGMAVNDYYFGHGAAGRGDWYATTPHGDVQVQDQDNPGFDAFNIHAIGGIVFYQPISGDYGADENTEVESTASGYQTMAIDGTDIHKYMLADNGVVYEHISVKEETSLSSGFGEFNDDGTRGEYAPASRFEVSGDQDAQEEWQRILSKYQ
ncbi:hypothetical protein [Jeotgalicoccus meleagridis]|uniref:Lipoprotein n=1 Tax=Jeotgalicoccus meleagridis TaxID=2759181 RepID=A0A6V7RHH8_9STAP|nr:hypothetical protein [Jeotgalicoccus meleagridis]CAD2077425.1 hypothetical protein JEODO184_01150 [Jeotgalicoccus meleagridis]